MSLHVCFVNDYSRKRTILVTATRLRYSAVLSTPQEKSTALLPNPNILVSENEEINNLFLQEILRLNNINTYHARDGLEAIEVIKTNPDIHLVLMDIKMPRMGGIGPEPLFFILAIAS